MSKFMFRQSLFFLNPLSRYFHDAALVVRRHLGMQRRNESGGGKVEGRRMDEGGDGEVESNNFKGTTRTRLYRCIVCIVVLLLESYRQLLLLCN